ncbi:putative quinol monooxygenase [Streptomyces sp. Pv4-95]|uniref:putative quinol monooxygenase n=1 Tax=Streptomyces sp. Pv4-95 TaxID=3049543 RepID=UPI0038921A6C
MPVVVATMRTKPGRREDVLAAFRRHAPAVHAEPGCLLYAAHSGDDRVTIVEHWTDQAALDAHSAGPAMAALIGDITDAMAAPVDVAVLDPVPAGDPAKGVLAKG